MSDTLMGSGEITHRYDPVLGLKVHIELETAAKMFDTASDVFGTQPNTMVTPALVSLPGTLSAVNVHGVEYTICIGLASGCEIAQSCRFTRKNYFYPNLAKDFQTSQSDKPIVYDGVLEIGMKDDSPFTIPIGRAHMEEDAGENTHIGDADGRIEGASHSLMDYNRAGVPLAEIVIHLIEGIGARVSQVAAAYVRTLCNIFWALGVSETRMEYDNVRADVNVSLYELLDTPLGTRIETKNASIFRGIERIVRYEIQRQAAILAAGGEVFQETRRDQAGGTTRASRVKSDADNYRCFPKPDLVPVTLSREQVEEIRTGLPEVPVARRRRLKAEQGLSDAETHDATNVGVPGLTETTVAAGVTGQTACKWWMGEFSRTAKKQEMALGDMVVTPEQIAKL